MLLVSKNWIMKRMSRSRNDNDDVVASQGRVMFLILDVPVFLSVKSTRTEVVVQIYEIHITALFLNEGEKRGTKASLFYSLLFLISHVSQNQTNRD